MKNRGGLRNAKECGRVKEEEMEDLDDKVNNDEEKVITNDK